MFGLPLNSVLYGMLIVMFISLFGIIMDILRFILEHFKIILCIGIIAYLFSGMGGKLFNQAKSSFLGELSQVVNGYVTYITDLLHF